MDRYVERYPGLLALLEEFEHMSLAREDGDGEAVRYFKRQKRLREDGVEVGETSMEDIEFCEGDIEVKEDLDAEDGGERVDDDMMGERVKEEMVQRDGEGMLNGDGKGKSPVFDSTTSIHQSDPSSFKESTPKQDTSIPNRSTPEPSLPLSRTSNSPNSPSSETNAPTSEDTYALYFDNRESREISRISNTDGGGESLMNGHADGM